MLYLPKDQRGTDADWAKAQWSIKLFQHSNRMQKTSLVFQEIRWRGLRNCHLTAKGGQWLPVMNALLSNLYLWTLWSDQCAHCIFTSSSLHIVNRSNLSILPRPRSDHQPRSKCYAEPGCCEILIRKLVAYRISGKARTMIALCNFACKEWKVAWSQRNVNLELML